MKIFHTKTRDEAAEAAAEALNFFLKNHKKTAVLLLVSGGSALNVLDFADESLLGENLTISVTDERFSADPQLNNFARLQTTGFYELAQQKGASFIGTLPRPGETITQLSQRFETALKNWRQTNTEGKIFAILGMGPDGHTAGIFAFPQYPERFRKLFCDKNWIVDYDNQGQKPPKDRITITLTFFKQIDEAVVFISGPEKRTALNLLIAGHGQVYENPALAFKQIRALKIFTELE